MHTFIHAYMHTCIHTYIHTYTSQGSCSTSETGFCKLVVDTGTSFLTAPSRETRNILRYIRAESNCINIHQLPDITYVLPGGVYTLTAHDYVISSAVPVQCVAVCCTVLQYVAVCCSVLQCHDYVVSSAIPV